MFTGADRSTVNTDVIGRKWLEWTGHEGEVFFLENNRDELFADRFVEGEILVRQHGLEAGRLSALFRIPLSVPVVGFRADNQDNVRHAQVLEHPPYPSFGGLLLVILVYDALDAFSTEAVRQRANLAVMLSRLMTITDKYLDVYRRGSLDGAAHGIRMLNHGSWPSPSLNDSRLRMVL